MGRLECRSARLPGSATGGTILTIIKTGGMAPTLGFGDGMNGMEGPGGGGTTGGGVGTTGSTGGTGQNSGYLF